MRRLLALLLLATFGLPVVAQALTLTRDPDANLPICCRRHGAHHCTMNQGRTQNAPAFSIQCPSFPRTAATAPVGTNAGLTISAQATFAHTFALAATPRAATPRRLTRERSRHKRGPPQISI
ncbi:MAG: hypothetical protein V4555_16135 [Acidobacteriota bacterium]